MSNAFRYSTRTLGTWDCDTPKEMTRRLLTEMAVTLQRMELEGILERELCPVPGRNPGPHSIEHAERCRDKTFRKEGIAAAIKLVEFVRDAPEDLDPFVRMASHGRVTAEVAAEFEPTVWVILGNYAFLKGRHTKEHGRDPLYFLHLAADSFGLKSSASKRPATRVRAAVIPSSPFTRTTNATH